MKHEDENVIPFPKSASVLTSAADARVASAPLAEATPRFSLRALTPKGKQGLAQLEHVLGKLEVST